MKSNTNNDDYDRSEQKEIWKKVVRIVKNRKRICDFFIRIGRRGFRDRDRIGSSDKSARKTFRTSKLSNAIYNFLFRRIFIQFPNHRSISSVSSFFFFFCSSQSNDSMCLCLYLCLFYRLSYYYIRFVMNYFFPPSSFTFVPNDSIQSFI
ncbi:hypothetical protein NH340_JMT01883 [Sarcoptes scabiei]|nr:hypothetical protein NH340_JMT01883 [Sarcoptes scabiei]